MTLFRSIEKIKNLKGKRVILRLDLNVPVENGAVLDGFRIRRSLPTINFLKKSGAKTIIIAHSENGTPSLKLVARYLNKFTQVGFVPAISGSLPRDAVSRMALGGAILLENLRSDKREKNNSALFAKELAGLGDIYVNEAFSVSHRKHASIIGLPKLLPGYAGMQFKKEYENLLRALKPQKPFLFMLGGAKFETKLPLIKKYLPVAETVFIGGALSNSLFKIKGYELGKSVVGKGIPGLKPLLKNKKILLPVDVRLLSGKAVSSDGLSPNDKIVDIGPATVKMLDKKISKAKSILFNGPVGIYNEGFGWGTEEILKLLAKSKADTVVGGGDTLAVISKLKLENKFSFVSTAGGAMLEFLATGSLPGIEALKESKK